MIQFSKFTKEDAASAMKEWIDSEGEVLPSLSKSHAQIREDIEKLYPEVEGERKEYFTDVEMGIALYEYLAKQEWFSMRLAADDSFWRIMTVLIAPHLVARRWNYDNLDHYYLRPRRNWFRAIWWYIYLSLVPTKMYKTRDILKSQNFSTDTIEAIVERPGSEGFNVKLYRKIVEYYSVAKCEGSVSDLFRSVMKLNTARVMVMEPALCEGGIDGYVRALFEDLNAEV